MTTSTDRTVVHHRFLNTPSDYALVAVVAAVALITVGVWITGQLAGLLFHAAWPPVGIGQGTGIAVRLPYHLSDPRQAWPEAARANLPGPFGFAVAALLVLATSVALGVLTTRLVGARRQIRGYASRRQLRTALSGTAALAAAARLRPTLARKPAVRDVAVDLGRAVGTGQRLWASIENSVLLIAAPRQGKTSQVIIPWLRTWPGPALVTSVRADVALATMTLRAASGPVAVMDLTGTPWPQPLRWSPVSHCEQFDKARQRADLMVTVGKPETGPSDSTNAGFFGLTATNLLAGWLHAAALTGRTMTDVLTWALDERLDEPITLLRDHPAAAPGVAAMLDNIYRAPTETRSNMWTTAMTAVAPLLSHHARATFCPPTGLSFDIPAFLTGHGTVYLLVAEHQAADLAPLIAAFVNEITEAAKQLADTTPAGRLDPPLGLILDEVANVSPLPQLPALMSYAAGSGIFVVAVLQNLAQARHRWGRDGADMLWGASRIKIALGGLGGDELGEFSKLAGEYRETILSYQHGPHGTTSQATLTDRKTISPHDVRMLDDTDRHALVIHATTPAVKTRMRRHYEGPDAALYAQAVTDATGQLEQARRRHHLSEDT